MRANASCEGDCFVGLGLDASVSTISPPRNDQKLILEEEC
jgi:hypothetical protein